MVLVQRMCHAYGAGQTALVPPTPWQLVWCPAGMGNLYELAQWLLERDGLSSYR